MKGQQLALPVQLRDSASFDSYFPGPNAEALDALRGGTEALLLFGPAASGKTHLLQASARASGAAYLPLREVAHYGPEALEGFEARKAVCLDDAEAVTEGRDWCVALLRLLDTLRQRGASLVVSATAAPERLGIALPDLRTRLTACTVYGLKPLSDQDRARMLRERAQARGLELPAEVSRWLLNQLPRDTATLLEVLERLDQASLAEQRRLTLPFVQQVTLPMLQGSLPLAPASADARTGPGR